MGSGVNCLPITSKSVSSIRCFHPFTSFEHTHTLTHSRMHTNIARRIHIQTRIHTHRYLIPKINLSRAILIVINSKCVYCVSLCEMATKSSQRNITDVFVCVDASKNLTFAIYKPKSLYCLLLGVSFVRVCVQVCDPEQVMPKPCQDEPNQSQPNQTKSIAWSPTLWKI